MPHWNDMSINHQCNQRLLPCISHSPHAFVSLQVKDGTLMTDVSSGVSSLTSKVNDGAGISLVNILRPIQNDSHFPDDIFKCIFLNENVWISIRISLKFVSKIPIDNKAELVQIMVWCLTGDKLLSEPMMAYYTDTYMHHSASRS